jgi:hypothetical protein
MTGIPLLVDLTLLALACGATVDLWLNGSIFASWRARVEARGGWLGELLGCSFCLNYHVPLWTTWLLWLPATLLSWPWYLVPRAILIWLAAGRLAWLINHAMGNKGYDRDRDDMRISRAREDP